MKTTYTDTAIREFILTKTVSSKLVDHEDLFFLNRTFLCSLGTKSRRIVRKETKEDRPRDWAMETKSWRSSSGTGGFAARVSCQFDRGMSHEHAIYFTGVISLVLKNCFFFQGLQTQSAVGRSTRSRWSTSTRKEIFGRYEDGIRMRFKVECIFVA